MPIYPGQNLTWYATGWSDQYSLLPYQSDTNATTIAKILYEIDPTIQCESVAGILGSCFVASGLNPCTWFDYTTNFYKSPVDQNVPADMNNQNYGYGLLNFTPPITIYHAMSYPHYNPYFLNQSVDPYDGYAQTMLINSGTGFVGATPSEDIAWYYHSNNYGVTGETLARIKGNEYTSRMPNTLIYRFQNDPIHGSQTEDEISDWSSYFYYLIRSIWQRKKGMPMWMMCQWLKP